MEGMAESVKRVHEYAQLTPEEELSNVWDCLPLSETPTNSSRLPKMRRVSEPSNMDILKAIERLGKMQDAFMEKLLEIERTVTSNSTLISELVTKLDSINDKTKRAVTLAKTDEVSVQVETVISENKQLWERVDELDDVAYKRRWNLKMSGIPEEAGENVKMIAMDLFSLVSPGLRDVLQTSIDVAHRIDPRRIIVQFLSRTHRNRIWLDATNTEILKQKGIKITRSDTTE